MGRSPIWTLYSDSVSESSLISGVDRDTPSAGSLVGHLTAIGERLRPRRIVRHPAILGMGREANGVLTGAGGLLHMASIVPCVALVKKFVGLSFRPRAAWRESQSNEILAWRTGPRTQRAPPSADKFLSGTPRFFGWGSRHWRVHRGNDGLAGLPSYPAPTTLRSLGLPKFEPYQVGPSADMEPCGSAKFPRDRNRACHTPQTSRSGPDTSPGRYRGVQIPGALNGLVLVGGAGFRLRASETTLPQQWLDVKHSRFPIPRHLP